jgi:hypothetical protein
MPRPLKLTREQRDLVVRAYADGKPLTEIAKSHGISRQSVINMAWRAGLPPRVPRNHDAPGLDPAVRVLLARMRDAGRSIPGTALDAGVCERAMRRWRTGKTIPNVMDLRAALNAVGLDLAVMSTHEPGE